MKTQGKTRFTKKIRAISGTPDSTALSLGFLIFLLWPVHRNLPDLQDMFSSSQAHLMATRNPNLQLDSPPFVCLLENHDRFLPEFDRWRRTFAENATEMAKLIRSFPGGEVLSEDSLFSLFVKGTTKRNAGNPVDIFLPWTNRWSGVWSNGIAQYHNWDTTRAVEGRWIQPVTISETRFIEDGSVEAMFRLGQADVAINVISSELEITGWVSKTQSTELELPHIGYLVNDTTLIWICQIKTMDTLFEDDNRWMVFLETVNRVATPSTYQIYGLPVQMVDSVYVESSERDKHRATYYSSHVTRRARLSVGMKL